jgi:hypothetical protein
LHTEKNYLVEVVVLEIAEFALVKKDAVPHVWEEEP